MPRAGPVPVLQAVSKLLLLLWMMQHGDLPSGAMLKVQWEKPDEHSFYQAALEPSGPDARGSVWFTSKSVCIYIDISQPNTGFNRTLRQTAKRKESGAEISLLILECQWCVVYMMFIMQYIRIEHLLNSYSKQILGSVLIEKPLIAGIASATTAHSLFCSSWCLIMGSDEVIA